MTRNQGMLITIRRVDDHRWMVQYGKRRWYFTLPDEQMAMSNQIFALVGYGEQRMERVISRLPINRSAR